VKVDSSADVLENWERIKREEKGRSFAHDGVPTGQPALPLATKLIYRAQKNHLTTPKISNLEIPTNEESLGQELLSLIAWAVEHGLDPEVALRKAALEFREAMTEEESR
jgi:XTP/dITP diphosphohydrolase